MPFDHVVAEYIRALDQAELNALPSFVRAFANLLYDPTKWSSWNEFGNSMGTLLLAAWIFALGLNLISALARLTRHKAEHSS